MPSQLGCQANQSRKQPLTQPPQSSIMADVPSATFSIYPGLGMAQGFGFCPVTFGSQPFVLINSNITDYKVLPVQLQCTI